MKSKTHIVSLLIVLLFGFPISVIAADGKAIFVIGKVQLVNSHGDKVRLKRGSKVSTGDLIITEKKGQVQIKMTDGTLLAVRPNSKFKISEYQYDKNIDTDKSIYNLVKGGLRSITGKMGKAKKSSYAVETVVGTIGIRGTDFSARMCESNCGDQEDGLYVGVMQGGVVLENDSGSLDISPGDFGFMSELGVEPVYLDEMPGDLLFAKTNKENNQIAQADNAANASNSATIGENTLQSTLESSLEDDNLFSSSTEPTITPNPEEYLIPEDEVVPLPDTPDLVFPSIGVATYTSTSQNIELSSGLIAGSLDVDTTQLTVNFSSSEVDVDYDFKNVILLGDPITQTWTSSNISPMTLDQNGDFNGDLSGTNGTATLTGSTSGSLQNTTPDIVDVPETGNSIYSLSDGSNTINGAVDFTLSTVE